MTLTHAVLLLLAATLASADLVLVPATTAESLALEYVNVFLGEFPCMNPNISGSRRLLRFASEISNPTNAVERRSAVPPLSYRILTLGGTTVLSGAVVLPCLRDTACSGGGDPTYYSCTPPAVSSGCETITARHTICHWVDITPLPQSSYRLYLEFESSSIDLPFSVPSLPRISRGGAARIAVAMASTVGFALCVIFIPWGMWRSRRSQTSSPPKDD